MLSKKQQKQFKENDQKKEKLETQQFQKRPSISKPILMGNASIPINSSKETNIIQLQQCEPMPPEHRPTSGIEVTSSNGVGLGNKGFTNLAYEKSDTTHL